MITTRKNPQSDLMPFFQRRKVSDKVEVSFFYKVSFFGGNEVLSQVDLMWALNEIGSLNGCLITENVS